VTVSTLAETREDLAAALSEIDGYDVRPRPFTSAPKPGDGWVTVQRLAPSDFTRSMATLTVVIVLSPDQAQAEIAFDEDAVDFLDTVTIDTACLNPTDVALEAMALIVGNDAAPLYCASLTLSVEVD
jgi:hypothetical protein